MNTKLFLKTAIMALPLILASCGAKKKAVEETTPAAANITRSVFLEKVKGNASPQQPQFITSKVKFNVAAGSQDVSLSGNLKMKRDDVIRLQLMAFGLVEAARLEFTKDYVLIMDRINKQYLKAPYADVDFLRSSGLNFHTLQALFWNELFQPNHTTLSADDFEKFITETENEDAVIKYEDKTFDYSWVASRSTGIIKKADVVYKDHGPSNTGLKWTYANFKEMKEGGRQFPNDMDIVLATSKKDVKLEIRLNGIGHESDWEPYTEVSSKYREVTVEEILKRVMSL